LPQRIAWRNYYDYADPVGFKLDTARDWMRDHGWNNFFEFERKHDFGFARYFVPGKAHNDYWDDPLVFGHFIYDVLKLSPIVDGTKVESPPPSRKWARFSSYFTPYLVILLIFAGAVYLVHAAVNALTKDNEGLLTIIRHVSGLTCLLVGTTVASRIPCLTRKPSFKLLSAVLFALFAFLYLVLYAGWTWNSPLAIRPGDLLAIILAILAVCFSIWSDRHKTFLQRWPPARLFARGMRPLLIAGGLAAAILVLRQIRGHGGDNLWPLILSSAAFIYLWWLAAILFDLFFTWQRYIRLAVWQEYLRQARKDRISREKELRTRELPAK
jgi:cytochrome bd-type quinol oxidase subunit 2